MAEPVRHRRTKGAATDTFSLQQPRHTSTLRSAIAPIKQQPRRSYADAFVAALQGLSERRDRCWAMLAGERLNVDLRLASAARITAPAWHEAVA
jgi:hypothetical protein